MRHALVFFAVLFLLGGCLSGQKPGNGGIGTSDPVEGVTRTVLAYVFDPQGPYVLAGDGRHYRYVLVKIVRTRTIDAARATTTTTATEYAVSSTADGSAPATDDETVYDPTAITVDGVSTLVVTGANGAVTGRAALLFEAPGDALGGTNYYPALLGFKPSSAGGISASLVLSTPPPSSTQNGSLKMAQYYAGAAGGDIALSRSDAVYQTSVGVNPGTVQATYAGVVGELDLPTNGGDPSMRYDAGGANQSVTGLYLRTTIPLK